MTDSSLIGLVVLFFHVVVAPVAIMHALLYKRDYRSALGWIGVSILFPIAGPLLYFFFGVNRLRRRARELTGSDPATAATFSIDEGISYPPPTVAPERHPHPLARVGWNTSAVRVEHGNIVTMLRNGDAFFPRLLASIEGSRERVWISSYIFSGHGIGGEIADALQRAAARGVDTRVIVDGVGAWYSNRSLSRRLHGGGVRFAEYLPPRLIPPALHWNLRNHRKIAVIDDGIAFFGGLNIDDRHFLDPPRVAHPHEDLHFELHGPAVVALAQVFARDWYVATREEVETGEPARAAGTVAVRVIEDGPDESMDRLAMTLLGLISGARDRIRIMTPYFLPHRELIGALQAAAVRGVSVEILLPEKSNLRYVDWACQHQLWELLKWGLRIRLKPAPFAHSKLMTIDDDYVLGGSANLDPRSLRLNFEIGVEMFDPALAAEAQRYFDAYWETASEVTLEDVDRRPLPSKLRDGFFWLFSAYL